MSITGEKVSEPVILVRRSDSGNGGTEVHWFADLWSAERNHSVMSASCRGVSIRTAFLHEIPTQWLDTAKGVYASLKEDHMLDMAHLATHGHSGASNGPLVPVGSGDWP